MLKWIARIMVAILIICAIGVFAANALGTAMDHDILALSWAPNTGDSQLYGFYDIERQLTLPYHIPVENIRTSQMVGLQQFLLLTQSEPLDSEADRLSQQIHQFGLDVYDLEQDQVFPLLHYTDHNGRRPSSFHLYSDIYPLLSASGSTRLLAFYDTLLDKLFIYDRLNNYQHFATLALSVVSRNGIGPVIQWSPDQRKFAVIFDGNTLLVMNTDGSDKHYYKAPYLDEYYPLWSSDSTNLLLIPQNGAFMFPLTVLNVETGEWASDLSRIVGRNPSWMCKNQWIKYETRRPLSTEKEIHLLHVASGRIIHLTDNPVLADLEISEVNSADCEHLMITTGRDANTLGTPTSVYVTTFDLADVRLVTDAAVPGHTWLDGDSIIYQVRMDDNWLGQFREPLDGSAEPELISRLPPETNALGPTFDNGQKALYMDYSRGFDNIVINVLDLSTGEMSPINDVEDRYTYAYPLYND